MARPEGRKNETHEATREALLERASRHFMFADDGPGASFRDLAAACDVSPSTLRHYFTDKDALVDAVFAWLARQGEPYLVNAVVDVPADLETSLRGFVGELLLGWRAGVGRIHAFALKAGLSNARFGPAYVERLLEPTLQVVEARLACHVANGTLPACDLRAAALSFVSPVFLALLHQDDLLGVRCRPLDVNVFVDEHLRRFLRAWGPPAPTNATNATNAPNTPAPATPPTEPSA